MARILITSGPTRQYLDPVRYLTNASSGQMGRALAAAAIESGHEVIVVTGPVAVRYPDEASIVRVETTDEMLRASQESFPHCDGLIGAAAPCDYRPERVESSKISKTGGPLVLHLVETPDIVATLGQTRKPHQWIVGFALETDDQRFRALTKMERKCCDLMVLNGPEAINSSDNKAEIIDRDGQTRRRVDGSKELLAAAVMELIGNLLIDEYTRSPERDVPSREER